MRKTIKGLGENSMLGDFMNFLKTPWMDEKMGEKKGDFSFWTLQPTFLDDVFQWGGLRTCDGDGMLKA